MATDKESTQQERDELFNKIRHNIATNHNCPKHLSMLDLKVIYAILSVKQEET